MNWFRPLLTPIQWLTIVMATILGGIIAGAYGVLHDQITFSISPEYFIAMKYPQFGAQEWTLPDRWRVALIGFRASWPLGAAVGLVCSRISIVSFASPQGCRQYAIALGIVLATTVLSGLAGGLLTGPRSAREPQQWSDYQTIYELADLPAFIRVAEIHRAGYLGAAVGVLLAIGYLIWMISRRGARK